MKEHLLIALESLLAVSDQLINLTQIVETDSVERLESLCLFEAFHGLDVALHFLVQISYCAPHPAVLEVGVQSLLKVLQGVLEMAVHLIGLSQAVPGPVVPGIDLDCLVVGIDCSLDIFELEELVPEESVCSQKLRVYLGASGEVLGRLDVLPHKGVIVPQDALGFWNVFVQLVAPESQPPQVVLSLLNIVDVGENIHALVSVGVLLLNQLEDLH